MSAWIEPVINRSQSDIDYIKSLSSKIISGGFNSLTIDEKWYWWLGEEKNLSAINDLLITVDDKQLIVGSGTIKGCLNITDLHRIENNIEYLYNILVEYGNIVSIETGDIIWKQSDFPILSEIDRIKSNIKGLLNKISYNSIIQLNDLYIDYYDLNTLEFEINQLNFLLLNMISNFRYSGEFYSGTNFNF